MIEAIYAVALPDFPFIRKIIADGWRPSHSDYMAIWKRTIRNPKRAELCISTMLEF